MKINIEWQKNAQEWKMVSSGNAKCSVPVGGRPIKMHPPNVSKAGLQKCVRTRAATANRSENIVDFPQKTRFLGISRRCFSRLSPHPVQSGKSHLLSILIIYLYVHACQVSGKSYDYFLRSRLKSIKMSMIWTGNGRRLGVGPFPLLDCQNPLKKRRPPRMTARQNR